MNTSRSNNVFQSFGSNAVQATTTVLKATNSALTSVSDFATQTVPEAATSLANSVSEFATETVPAAANSMFAAVNSAATTTINAISPFSMNATTPSKNTNANTNTNTNTNTNKNNVFTNISNNISNVSNNIAKNTSEASGIPFPVIVFVVLVLGILTVIFLFKTQIEESYKNLVIYVKKVFGYDTTDLTQPELPSITKPPETSLDQTEKAKKDSTSIINKILPFGTKEVFNVSNNEYNYYDAEPLCEALGAELASYDQVKDAWQNGADWCNYGWVKGQVAVFPTQKETWEKVQSGPDDERNACGRPGVNGGYFDNPEMRFGVNCYGVKPEQSANDEKVLMMNGSIPKTAAALKVDQKVEELKAQLDTIGVLPFNNDKWGST